MKHVRVKGFHAVLLLCILGAIMQTACVGAGAAAGARAPGALAAPPASGFGPPKLMLFGGADHKTYLGCLNCSQYAIDSVFNQYGTNGSPYSSASIWNHYGEYGSPYSLYSACNPYASDPSVIVDHDGKYYGRLTKNSYHPEIGAGRQYVTWLTDNVCEQ